MLVTVFDIETGPQNPKDIMERFEKFGKQKVAVGGLVDEAKIHAKIKKAGTARLDKAPLHAEDGRVVAIGYEDTETTIMGVGEAGHTEALLLTAFWETFEEKQRAQGLLVGFNIHDFDLPFLYRRSCINGVRIPENAIREHRWWDRTFVDLLQIWKCGKREDYISLGEVAHVLGIKGKTEGVEGKDFHRLWNGTPEERLKAREYLTDDLRITRAIADHFTRSAPGGTL